MPHRTDRERPDPGPVCPARYHRIAADAPVRAGRHPGLETRSLDRKIAAAPNNRSTRARASCPSSPDGPKTKKARSGKNACPNSTASNASTSGKPPKSRSTPSPPKSDTRHGGGGDLSNEAVVDAQTGPVCNMRVRMARADIEVDGKRVQLTPGMTVTVESKTGKRRMIEFFLSPLLRYASESARER